MGRPRKSDVYKANATPLGDLAKPLREAARTLRASAERGYSTIDNFDWLGDTREAAVGRAERDMTANRVKADHLDELADAHENGSKTMQPMIEGLKSKGRGLEGNTFEVSEDWEARDRYDYDAARRLAKMMDPDGTAGLQAEVDKLQAQRANEAATETGNMQRLADELGVADTTTDTAIGNALAALEQTPAPTPGGKPTAQQATFQQDKPTTPDGATPPVADPKTVDPKVLGLPPGIDPNATPSGALTDPSKLLDKSLPKPTPDPNAGVQKAAIDPKALGSLGSVAGIVEANRKPEAKPADQPAPQSKGFLDGWVDAAKQKAEGIVEHVGDLVGLHGADKAKDAWVDVGIGVAKDALDEATGNPGHVPSALDQTIDAYNKAEYAKAHGGSAASLAGAGLFDMQAKSAEATAAIATGGTGRLLERGIVEGAIGAESRAALHEGIPTLDNTLHNTVKGFLNDALHPETPAPPHVETPSVPHVETPAVPHAEPSAVPRAEIPTAPHVEAPAAPHVETPAVPHAEAPAVPHHETPAAPHAEPAPRSETPAVPRAETPATPHTPQPVEHTPSGAGHAGTNSAPIEHNPTSPPAITESHPRGDGAVSNNPSIGDHSPVGGDHHPNGHMGDDGGAPLRSADDILHEARDAHRAERDQMDWDRGEQNLQDLATHHGVSVDELPRTPQYDIHHPTYTDKLGPEHSAEIDRQTGLWEHGFNTQSVQQVLDHMDTPRPPTTELRDELRQGLSDYGYEDLRKAGYGPEQAEQLAKTYANEQFPRDSGLIPQPATHNPDGAIGGYPNALTYGDWRVNNALGTLTKQEKDAFRAWLQTQDPNAIVNINLGRK